MATRLAASWKEAPFLPLAAPWFDSAERNEVLATLDSDWITTGPRTQRFEIEFAAYVGASYAVAVNSCTAALHLSLAALEIGPGDCVVTSPFTFVATANVIVHQGADPIFIDIDPATYNLDTGKLEEFVTRECSWVPEQKCLRVHSTGKRLRAIIAVHYGGHPCDMEAITRIAEQFGLFVIEDAAHALGAVYREKRVGVLGDTACFSFYPTKNISTVEGGMLTTNNPALAERARVLTLHGIDRDAWNRYAKDGSWQYDITAAGFKYNMTDVSAACGIHQLQKLPSFLARREELACRYSNGLGRLPLQQPTISPGVSSAWHLYPVQVLSDQITRDELIEALRAVKIGTSVHFIPLHLMTYYQRTLGYKRGDFPVAEQVFARIVSLPLFPRMTNNDLERVVRAVHDILTARC